MLVWEDREQIDSYRQILDEIEKVGEPAKHFRPKLRWTQSSKQWEYPFAYLWLKQLFEKLNLNRKLKVMDFGCGENPFPQFLANKDFEVWGIDDDSAGYIVSHKEEMDLHYPDVTYWIGDIFDFDLTKFDAIVSCSVLEHIVPSNCRIETIKKLKRLLEPHGKMMHIIDFYFPEKHLLRKDTLENGRLCYFDRVDFYETCKTFNFSIENLAMCPGAPDFNFNKIRNKINFVLPPKRMASRIAIGDVF